MKKIERNTEYTIIMPNGKTQKFAYYGEKANGRLILLNTLYGTLTSMNAVYFLKLIGRNRRVSTRPYNVEYPEGYEQVKAPSEFINTAKKIEECNARKEQERAKENDKYNKETLKWAARLRTLPDREAEILEKELKIAPHTLGDNLEKWILGTYEGSNAQIAEAYEKATTLLKGTAWGVR